MKHFISAKVGRLLYLLICLIPTLLSASSVKLEKGSFQLVLSEQESAPVRLAASTLASDFMKVMRFKPQIASSANNAKGIDIVIVNTSSPDAQQYTDLRPLDDFESHRVYCDVYKQRIYLLGKDMRGTIYAIYTFSEKFLKVPPLWFYSGWIPQYMSSVTMADDYDFFLKSPQVRYRTWFPNDEDLFTPWRKLSADNNERWLETMLRLKQNTVELGATVTYPEYKLGGDAELLRKYGLILTSHHMVGLNNSFATWDNYWREVRKMEPPQLLVSNIKALTEFWEYCVETVCRDKQENLWQIAFRGKKDEPFWAVFADAPKTDKERAEVINRMIRIQYDLIKKATGETDPFVRMTFYDEISDLLAKGYLKPPASNNMLWTFVAGRRDHYPYDDLVAFDGSKGVKLGYYMNLQFTSTGAHLAPAEGPWKMEFNYRYVSSKGPLTLAVVNSGNIREFVMEMAANARMMWDMESYNTDGFLVEFCEQYFGETHAREVADLYHDYYYSFWQQRPNEFPNIERQFIFQDLRYGQAFNQIGSRFDRFDANPLNDIGFERVKGRSFRLTGDNQVDTMLVGTHKAIERFEKVATRCDEMMKQLPIETQSLFYDNLSGYAHYMASLNRALYHFLYAYKYIDKRHENLQIALDNMIAARDALYASQHDVFTTWYAGDRIFGLEYKVRMLKRLVEKYK